MNMWKRMYLIIFKERHLFEGGLHQIFSYTWCTSKILAGTQNEDVLAYIQYVIHLTYIYLPKSQEGHLS